MAIKDIFKRKKIAKVKEEKVEAKKPVGTKPESIKEKLKERRVISEAYKILETPQITEKTTALAEKNQYTFKVWPKANKVEIKKAIESLYGVEVEGVRIIKVPPKRRRLGRIIGWRKGYKKAIVKIKEGQKIEVLPR